MPGEVSGGNGSIAVGIGAGRGVETGRSDTGAGGVEGCANASGGVDSIVAAGGGTDCGGCDCGGTDCGGCDRGGIETPLGGWVIPPP